MSDGSVHSETVEDVLARLDVHVDEGLSAEEVRRRRSEHGPNRLREPERRSALRILLDQFASTVIGVLLAAAVLAMVARQWIESAAILAVLVLNAGIGFASEWRARRSMQALREMARHEALVRREGEERRVAADELVPGDVLLLVPGDVVPADARLVEGEGMRTNEAALTGESVTVGKAPDPVEEDAPLAERADMLFRGTTVADGRGVAVVSAIGTATELGRIAELAESAEAAETPLEKRLDRLGRRLAIATLVIVAAIAAFGLAAGRPTFLMLETAVALGVAAIPEGLPIVATLALARGMWLMAQRQALINRLAAVETLGATRVIFSDKTGTLTENRMTLRRIDTASGSHEVGGEEAGEPDTLARRALEIAVLCNGASLGDEASGEDAEGDPTEVALLRAGAEAGLARDELLEQKPRVREVPFDSETMRMATFHGGNDGLEVAVKGATGAVLDVCDDVATDPTGRAALDEEGRQQWKERARSLADEGLRVLAVADKRVDTEDAEPYEGLRLVGLVGLLDPPREGVREAIEACRSAGIRVLVVTGDQAETARAIAREVGLGDEDGIRVLEGADLPEAEEGMSEEVRRRIRETDVFARLSPKQKLDLVAIYQDSGEVVAMTGDGVNDAPALKKADIGIAMGRRGTEAARQVSDMILRDDAFASIVAAVEQGRIIFGNIRKAVVFMLCTNGAEILAVAVASFAAMPLPLRPLQILYLNVLTDVLPALALGVGAGSAVVMQRPPRAVGESVLTRSHWLAIGGWSCVIAACVLGALLLAQLVLGLEVLAAVTVSFLTLGLAKLWFVFNLRDPDTGLADDDVLGNPWIWASIAVCIGLLGAAVYAPGLSYVLETRALWLSGVGVALGMSVVPAVLGQALRVVRRLR